MVYHTYQQVAELLGISDDSVRNLVKAGKLRAVNVGSGSIKGRYRIPEDSLNEFLEYREVQPPAPKAPRRRVGKLPAVPNYF